VTRVLKLSPEMAKVVGAPEATRPQILQKLCVREVWGGGGGCVVSPLLQWGARGFTNAPPPTHAERAQVGVHP
jgi:hypothetical protein